MRGDRGGQTLCLIERLSRMAGVQPRRIGLSATIGDPERTGAFLSQGTGRDCVIPRFEEPRRVWRISMEHFYNSGPQAQQRGFMGTGPQEAEVLACERIDAAASAALPAGAQDMRHSGQLTQEERRQRRERAQGKAAPKDRQASSAPEGKVDIPQAPEQALLNPTDTAPDNADPGMDISLNTRAAESAWSLPTRARRQRPYAPCCVATARAGTSPTASLSITATSRHRYARRQKSSCATRNRHRQPSPPPRWSSALISVAWSARSRSMHRLPSAPFCSAWDARDAAIFRPRCGLSCARKSPSRAR